MHGLINRAIERFVRDTYGPECWKNIAHQAELESSDFEAMLTYEDSVTIDVLKAAGLVLKRPRVEILEDIGTYLVSHPNAESLRRLLRFGGENFHEFLHSLDELPDRARLAVPDLELPEIKLREHGNECFSLSCRSKINGFGFVLIGVLRAMADDYGALALIEHQGSNQEAEAISVTLIQSRFSDGRDFDLGARIS